jgi:hypothetical protein
VAITGRVNEGGGFTITVDQQAFQRLQSLPGGIRSVLQSAEEDFAKRATGLFQGWSPVGLQYVPLGRTQKGKKKARGKRKQFKQSARLKRSWEWSRVGTEGVVIGTPVPYAYILEQGLYPGTTPSWLQTMSAPGKGGVYGVRTVREGGKIWSSQAVGGIIGKFMESVQLEKLMSYIVRRIGAALERA